MISDGRRNEPALEVEVESAWAARVFVRNQETGRYWDGSAYQRRRTPVVVETRAADKPRRAKARRPVAGGRTK